MGLFSTPDVKPPVVPPTPIKADPARTKQQQGLPSLVGSSTAIPPLQRKAKTDKPSLIGGA